jgi:hypothetical protein
MEPTVIGIIGCGDISEAYLKGAARSLGAAHQACRRALDAGRIGRPIAGAGAVLSHGMEHWHPNPEFFYKRAAARSTTLGPTT